MIWVHRALRGHSMHYIPCTAPHGANAMRGDPSGSTWIRVHVLQYQMPVLLLWATSSELRIWPHVAWYTFSPVNLVLFCPHTLFEYESPSSSGGKAW